MDVLIKGIKKLPEDGDYIHLIIQNGKVHTAISCGYLTTDKLNVGTVVKVPPHGRLIEGDELADVLEQNLEPMLVTRGVSGLQADVIKEVVDAIVTMLRECPTVLEAST